MKKTVLAAIIFITILSLYVTNNAYSQNLCINYESINSVIDNDSLDTSFFKQLFLKIYNGKDRHVDVNGKVDNYIDINKIINEDSIQFKVVYRFIVKVTKNEKNITVDFEKDSSKPFERIILIYKNIALGHIKFSVKNQFLIFYHKESDLYDFYQCFSKQHKILYLINCVRTCTFESGYLSDTFERCLNNTESVPVINDILKKYKEFDPNYEKDMLDLGPIDFFRSR